MNKAQISELMSFHSPFHASLRLLAIITAIKIGLLINALFRLLFVFTSPV